MTKKPRIREAMNTFIPAQKPTTKEELNRNIDALKEHGEELAEMTGVPEIAGYQQWANTVIKGAFEAIHQMDRKTVEPIFREMGKKCAHMAIPFFQLDPETRTDLDAFCRQFEESQLENCTLTRVGEHTVVWESHLDGRCVCPLVNEGLVPLTSKHCMCTTNWFKYLFDMVTGKDVEVEQVQTILSGAKSCMFRIHLIPSIYTTSLERDVSEG